MKSSKASCIKGRKFDLSLMDALPGKKQGTTLKSQHLLLEVAWEVCNQVGGIYTVIRSKAPVMVEQSKGHYCMIGPYVNKSIQAEVQPLNDSQDIFGQAAAALRKKGY